MAITKPPVLPVWGEDNTTSADMVQPTDPQIKTGWPLTTTPPSRQRFNWLFNLVTNAVRYFSRRGLVDYDATETYSSGDIVRGDNGLVYQSLVGSNINHLPSTSATQWGSLSTKTPAADDNTTKIATTAYVLGQISVSLPVMNGTAAIGTSTKFAKADHVHGSDTTKANTSGTYAGLSVGFATSAGAAPFSGIAGKPTTVIGYGITDAITTSTIGSQSVAFATNAGRAYPKRWDGNSIDIIYSGQPSQPNWLLGTNDGFNFYVYNPANFSVNYATNAALSVTQARGSSNTYIATTQFACPAYSHGGNGYDMRPSGLLDQWGIVYLADIPGSPFPGTADITFPVAFNSIFCPPMVTVYDSSGGAGGLFTPVCVAYSTTGATFYINELNPATQNVYLVWTARGN